MSRLNEDQKRVFDRVCEVLQNKNQILRLYVSGEGGTGKSFLIETIKHWIEINLKKVTATSAPTGIAACNINGLTIHRTFQLPVTHESMAKYTHLSDMILKTLREKLKNVELFIIDEVSMISNVTMMFINLRLCEIFDTTDTDDGFFGRKHILLFGDLLQLPPVKEQFSSVIMSRPEIQKYLSTMGGSDLWRLFEYDELLINMRQRCDNTYREILSRIRIGLVTDSDINVLQSRKINFKGSCGERLNELCTYMNQLPVDTICLLPTCYLCTTLNTAMLDKINGDEILLIAEDDVDCAPAMKKKVHKILKDKDEKVSETAGIERVIALKIGAKMMIQRNIDITLGLVNGIIGIVIAIHRSVDGNRIDSVTIVTSDNKQVIITRVDIKFEVFHKIVVHRKQFPFSLSYGIIVHKSQGITCKNAMMDLGTSVFTDGQVYVGLSRVSTLEGLHLINFNPASVTANSGAIAEYNRLRSVFKSQLPQINSSEKKAVKIYDCRWAIPHIIDDVQNYGCAEPESIVTWKIYGFCNDDRVSCYANVTLQCAFRCVRIRQQILKNRVSNALTDAVCAYAERKYCNILAVRRSVEERFEERT
ncbi:ATP-dependent DNA helicase PIF1 [Trachymyrmex cornetzi]|uniref:ATP-dependent DNA helicase n=2 Tax=Trachymyrmex cornetzi TaxID=471704 RepID=A0A151IU98_9HYME|nr:ATP-dependent DNA helicase PIF1 [Trachymyrmex cornetzi]